ncbi:MAG: type II CRISPR-associated endonuclease Cas1 [Ghiorsea sp.]|nr:type II CRISPR-associated endonuclease Cas1 [Ghiorsea sp.]
MAWRSIMIAHPARLKREQGALVVQQAESVRVPFEDIAVIVLAHREINITHGVLSACGEYGISLFSTDDTHHPNAVLLPFLQHSRATQVLRLQMCLSRPLAKRIWAVMVRQKIANQGICLDLMGKQGGQRMAAFVSQVRSGDSTMMESQAAAFYFTQLFGKGFGRSQVSWVNAALNYGYAVLRGCIARGLVAYGLFPSLGIHHASEQNAFNLADDVIEAFRPVVDLHVASLADEKASGLMPADKVALVSLLHHDIAMPRGHMTVLAAIEQSIQSLVRVMQYKDEKLLELPELVALSMHDHEV